MAGAQRGYVRQLRTDARGRGIGPWKAEYRDAAGKRHSQSGFSTKAEGVAWVSEQLAGVRRGRHIAPSAGKKSLGEWHGEWWASRVAELSTAATDAGRIKKYVLPRWEDHQLGAIRHTAVQGWVRELQKAGLAPATVRSIYQLLNSMLEAARKDDLIPDNPARGVNLPTIPPGTEVYLTRGEVDRIAAVIDNETLLIPHRQSGTRVEPKRVNPKHKGRPRRVPPGFNRVVVLLLAYTGMRWGEAAGLSWGRVHLDRRRIDVVDVLTEIGARREIKPYPKGKKRRSVPIPAVLHEALTLHRLERPGLDGDLVFRPEPQGALSRSTWGRDYFKPALLAAEITRDVRVHDLRHTCASWLLQSGVSEAEVGKLLGHESSATTRRYTHLKPDEFGAVLAAFDGVPVGL